MLSIGAVARQTGIEICTLRKWEARYGFPLPLRHPSGQRYFSEVQVQQLLTVVRRLSNGERIGKVTREIAANRLAVDRGGPIPSNDGDASPAIQAALATLCSNDASGLRLRLAKERKTRSIRDFVSDFAAPLTQLVGEYWMRGILPVHGEHLFSFLLETLLVREANLFDAAKREPQVILTTLAGERHTLGLSMVYAVLAEAGVACLRFPADLPVAEIAAAARAHQVKVIGISASSHFPSRMLRTLLPQLRDALPAEIDLWLGGAGMNKLCEIPTGSKIIPSMDQLLETCQLLSLIEPGDRQQA